jgi:two-component system sensor histidine kinase KdpD
VHYVEVAQDTEVKMEGERLRNSLLAALSHDLRTPLTALVGLSESLTLSRPELPDHQMELAAALRDEARRMSTLVANLLDMARIQSGGVKLNLQWQVIEELVGSALRACRWQLGARRVEVRMPRELPLVRFDAALLERVLCNLLENAAKYTPPGARIAIEADADAGTGALRVRVLDDGPGLPAGREDALFEKFVRGQAESSIAGVGLGLAICRAIVDAHGGRMQAWNMPAGGACFEFSLPLGDPPPLPAHDHPETQES